jgi:serine protease Do
VSWWRSANSTNGKDQSLASARAQSPNQIAESRRTAIVVAAETVGPAVVSVNVVSTQVVRERSPFDDPFFRGFFPPRERLRQVQNLGSGFIVSEDGYVITNQHVVSGATDIVVTLMDGRQLDAELVAGDEATDLAFLRVDGEDLPVATLGDSDNLLIGEWVIAIGNPYGYLLADQNPSVTVGVISALGRDVQPEVRGAGRQPQVWSNMIQTDAAINPGNSGGPLVNAQGEVIGVNAFIFSGTGGSIGLGFAIPINRARRALDDIVNFGSIRRPWTGLHLAELDSEDQPPRGVEVERVDPGSPAERVDLRPGDIITQTDGRVLPSPIEWEGRLLDLPSDRPIAIIAERNGEVFSVTLVPQEDPLVLAERLETPFDASVVVVTPTLASHLSLANDYGFYLDRVDLSSGFRRLGLRSGDILLAVGQRRLDGPEDLSEFVDALQSGRPLTLFIERNHAVHRTQRRRLPDLNALRGQHNATDIDA